MQNEKLCDHVKERCGWIVCSIRQAGKSLSLLELRYTSGPPPFNAVSFTSVYRILDGGM
jgi:hypothetical protein